MFEQDGYSLISQGSKLALHFSLQLSAALFTKPSSVQNFFLWKLVSVGCMQLFPLLLRISRKRVVIFFFPCKFYSFWRFLLLIVLCLPFLLWRRCHPHIGFIFFVIYVGVLQFLDAVLWSLLWVLGVVMAWVFLWFLLCLTVQLKVGIVAEVNEIHDSGYIMYLASSTIMYHCSHWLFY